MYVAGNNKKSPHKVSDIYPILTKFGLSRQMLTKFSNTKSYGNPSSGSLTDTCEQTDRHDKIIRRFSGLCKRAWKRRLRYFPRLIGILTNLSNSYQVLNILILVLSINLTYVRENLWPAMDISTYLPDSEPQKQFESAALPLQAACSAATPIAAVPKL